MWKRLIWIWWIALMTATASDQYLILSGSFRRNDITAEADKLRMALQEKPALVDIFLQHHIVYRTQKIKNVYFLTVAPIVSQSIRNQLILALAEVFPGMFFLQEFSNGEENFQPVSRKPMLLRTLRPRSSVDWIWFGVLILSFIGLIASIFQRKKMRLFRRDQSILHKNQDRIGHQMDTFMGGDNV